MEVRITKKKSKNGMTIQQLASSRKCIGFQWAGSAKYMLIKLRGNAGHTFARTSQWDGACTTCTLWTKGGPLEELLDHAKTEGEFDIFDTPEELYSWMAGE